MYSGVPNFFLCSISFWFKSFVYLSVKSLAGHKEIYCLGADSTDSAPGKAMDCEVECVCVGPLITREGFSFGKLPVDAACSRWLLLVGEARICPVGMVSLAAFDVLIKPSLQSLESQGCELTHNRVDKYSYGFIVFLFFDREIMSRQSLAGSGTPRSAGTE